MEDGTTHEADVIIMATGFHASKMLWPMEITGRGGRTIRGVWGDDDPRAYLGITVPGFPNLFLTYGPNTNLAHGGSIIFHADVRSAISPRPSGKWSSAATRHWKCGLTSTTLTTSLSTRSAAISCSRIPG
jgi:hypothetical protein